MFLLLQEDPGFRIGISEENADVFSSYHLAILSFKHAAPLLPLSIKMDRSKARESQSTPLLFTILELGVQQPPLVDFMETIISFCLLRG